MVSINYTFLGGEAVVREWGKKGTSSDITIYDKKESDVVRTWTLPTGFPDKIQPLFQAIQLGEYVIFYVTKLDKFTGEQIIALDVLGKDKGLLCHSYDVDRSQLSTMIKGTIVEKYKLVEAGDLKKEMESLPAVSKDGDAKVVIDHAFEVKGVGVVLLGKVECGRIKTYDNVKLLPSGKDVMIKSIQMHDDDVKEAAAPARVGLAVKGVNADDVQRGDVLCNSGNVKVSQEIVLDYKQNRYFKEDVKEGQTFVVNVEMQMKTAKIVSLNPMKLQFMKPVAFELGDVAVVLRPESQGVRIAGSGRIIN
ncbi:MAG: elongation factor Tu [Candidatus Aenigmarchaeota archaeon]|nr:elongation factor Tu [Candidatus Aenigmarchaeota archaeon]